MRTSFYKFQQRLDYKCISNNIKINYIDESYTSETCSKCGYYKKDLVINRDINGVKNIYTKYFSININE